jgi:hypothetical protein
LADLGFSPLDSARYDCVYMALFASTIAVRLQHSSADLGFSPLGSAS